jgi:type I restriction enzyme M protein
MSLKISNKTQDILSYESDVWASADVLRSSVGLKNSEFPDFMMPFFALRMVESRLIRKYDEVSKDPELVSLEDRIAEIKETVGFYNSMVIEESTTLSDIVLNDKNFHIDFKKYLDSFDVGLKNLLGIDSPDKTENLNLSAVVDSLRKKNALFGYVTAWAKIDFTPYDNSEITTLEEHIKRKWADMSAETAGEQYTPDDVINLISELIASDKFKNDKIYKLYDMTCGGGNMVFGVEDKLRKLDNSIKTETYGQELRGSLYALAKIESMFRKGSHIEHGNTLTHDKFAGVDFDYGVANPPYGVSWKEEYKTIMADETGRFGHGGYPSTSDGQLLFVQHMVSKLNETGKAFIVLNGSPLFSGDAGSGESNIRKWLLDNDYIEAFIQLPTGEFFNTSITTYIWCLNKDKPEERKDKILCINAEHQCVKLKKTKGVKSQEISKEHALNIVDIYSKFKDSDISKVLSKYDFYFNKQYIRKLEKDEEFGAIQESIQLKNIKSIIVKDREDESEETNISMDSLDISVDSVKSFNDFIKSVDNELQSLTIITDNNNSYTVDENNCVIKNDGINISNLGYGAINIKASFSKATARKEATLSISASIEQVWTKDEEKISFSDINNEENIQEFLKEWVSDDLSEIEFLDNIIGVEVNFNSVFPKNINIRKTDLILEDIKKIESILGDFK